MFMACLLIAALWRPGARTFVTSKSQIDDIVNDLANDDMTPERLALRELALRDFGILKTWYSRDLVFSRLGYFSRLGILAVSWQTSTMARMHKPQPAAIVPDSHQLAPVTGMVSSRLMVLANLLKRGAILRYRRTANLSSVEFGLVASLGHHPPMSVVQLAGAVGMDKGQISRALAGLVRRKLVSRHANPNDNREVLVGLTRSGKEAHDILLQGAVERTEKLLDGFSAPAISQLLSHIDHLTENAERMLEQEKVCDSGN
jgi:DNA-binding MarR family transcriptional regulator